MQIIKLVPPLRIWFLLVVVLQLTACSTLGYYVDLMNGHAEVLNSARPIKEVLAADDLNKDVKQALTEILAAREFAINELGLEANGNYVDYADLKRKYVVWNVIATDEFSISANKWCYWVVGCLSYRGFYSQEKAKRLAEELRLGGKDVLVAGVRAYSTLGWFNDPVLNTMLYRDEAMQLSLIFHELAHRKMYFKSDTAFNEAFATAVADEGVRRWYAAKGESEKYQHLVDKQKFQQAFNTLLKTTQSRLKKLYGQDLPSEEKRHKKQQVFELLKRDYKKLKNKWRKDSYDNWMTQDLNNAHLALVSTYHDLVPGFKAMLKKHNNDLDAFYSAVLAMRDMLPEQRHAKLKLLVKEKTQLREVGVIQDRAYPGKFLH